MFKLFCGIFNCVRQAGSGNSAIAADLAQKLKALVSDAPVGFKDVPCAQQANAFDCGMFMLKFARALCIQGDHTGIRLV